MLAYGFANYVLAQATLFGNARHLKFGCLRRNMWIKPRTGGRQQVDRNCSPRILRLQAVGVTLYSRNESLIRRPEIRSTGICRIVAGSSKGGARVEISGRREGLPNQSRSYHVTITRHQFSIGLLGKQNLRQPGN